MRVFAVTKLSCAIWHGGLLVLGVSMAATAQSPAVEVPSIPQLVISATRVERDGFDLPMAIDRIDASVITEAKPQVNLSEVLNRVPGIAAQNRQNYAQDLQISSRGFGARSTFGVRGVRLIADGIPATMPDGQGQAATFSLSSADRIEVLRGPFASLYGNASGGVVQIFTADGPAVPTVSGSFLAGSYGTYKAGTQFAGQQGSLNYRVDISRFHTDGYRLHSAATRDQLNAKFSSPLGSGKITVILNALHQPDTQDPLGLTRTQLKSDPRQVDVSALTFNTRKSIRQNQGGAVYDLGSPGNVGGALQAKIYSGDRAITQFLGQDGNTPLGSGGVVDLRRRYGGAGLRWARTIALDALAVRSLTFSAGLDGDHLEERRQGFVNNAGQQGMLKRDEDDSVANTDFYAQVEWRLTEDLRIHGGARHSRVKFKSTDRFITSLNPDDSGAVDYRRTTPVLGVLHALTSNWNVYANYGEGFETPTFAELAYRPNGATGLNFVLQPANSRHLELGIKGRISGSTRFNATLFNVRTRNEIVANSSSGGRSDFRNASRTRRDGVEISFERIFPAGFETTVAYTWLNARFQDAYNAGSPPVSVTSGNSLPGVARSVLFSELIWRHLPSGFHTAIEYRASSKIYVNEANNDAAAGFGVGNLRAGFQQQHTSGRGGRWRISEFVRIDNVTNHRYIGSVIVAEARGRFFEPAPGRNVTVGMNAAYSF